MLPQWNQFVQIQNKENDAPAQPNNYAHPTHNKDNQANQANHRAAHNSYDKASAQSQLLVERSLVSDHPTSLRYDRYDDEYFKLKELKFLLTTQISSITQIVEYASEQSVFKGSEKHLDINDLNMKLDRLKLHTEVPLDGLRDKLKGLFSNVHGFIEMSRDSYAAVILEIQANAKSSIDSFQLAKTIQHGALANDLRGTIEDVYSQKIKAEQAAQKQKLVYEKQIKELIDSKSSMQADYEGKVKSLKASLESASKTHREELIREKTSVKAIETTVRESLGEADRRVKAMKKRLEEAQYSAEKREELIRNLRAHIERVEGECNKLRRQGREWDTTVQQAVKEERRRNVGEIERERELYGRQIDAVKEHSRERERQIEEVVEGKLEAIMRRESEDGVARTQKATANNERYSTSNTAKGPSSIGTSQSSHNNPVSTSLDLASRFRNDFLHRHQPEAADTNSYSKRMLPSSTSYLTSSTDQASASYAQPTTTSKLKVKLSPTKAAAYSPSRATQRQLTSSKLLSNKKFTSEVDRYIDRMSSTSAGKKRLPAKKSSSFYAADQNTSTSVYRYPTPSEYEENYVSLVSSRIHSPSQSISVSPEANPRSPFRFPTPPEYARFHRSNSPAANETAEVDHSEMALQEKMSVVSGTSGTSGRVAGSVVSSEASPHETVEEEGEEAFINADSDA